MGDKERLEERLAEFEREKRGSDKKISQLQTKLNKASSELNEEKEVQKMLWLCLVKKLLCTVHVVYYMVTCLTLNKVLARNLCSDQFDAFIQ